MKPFLTRDSYAVGVYGAVVVRHLSPACMSSVALVLWISVTSQEKNVLHL